MPTDDFFRARIDQMIDLSHPLTVLARRMPLGKPGEGAGADIRTQGSQGAFGTGPRFVRADAGGGGSRRQPCWASTACDSPDGVAPVSEACLRPER